MSIVFSAGKIIGDTNLNRRLIFKKRKPEYSAKKILEQSRDEHIRRQLRESNPGHIAGEASALAVFPFVNKRCHLDEI